MKFHRAIDLCLPVFLAGSLCVLAPVRNLNAEDAQTKLLKQLLQDLKKDRAQSARTIQQLQQQVQRLTGQVQRLEQAVRSSMAPKRKLSIPSFSIKGSTLSEGAVQSALQPLTRKKLDVKELQAQVKSIVRGVYESQGIKGVQVIIPPQEISDKPFNVEIVEPKLGALDVRGNDAFSSANIRRFFDGQITNSDGVFVAQALEDQLDKANRHPDRQITAVLKPGEEPGVTDVVLDVKERKTIIHPWAPFHYQVEVNNTGTPNTGRIRVANTFQYGNVFNKDHTATVNWVFNPTDFENVQVVSGSYVIPDFLPGLDWPVSVAFYGGFSDVTAETVVDTLNIVGEGWTAGGQLSYELNKFRGWDSSVSVGLESTQLDNSLRFGSFSKIDTEIGFLPIYGRYVARKRDNWGGTVLHAGVRQNITGIASNGDSDNFKAFRQDSNASYTLFTFGLERYQKLFKDWTLFVNASGQFTTDRLVPSEQFRLGGADTVRGYDQSEVSGDKGILIRTEIRSPNLPFLITRLADFEGKREELQFVTFVDYGKAFISAPITGDPSDEAIASAGVGFRYRFMQYFLGTIDAAWPFDDTANTRSGNPQVHFSVVLNF